MGNLARKLTMFKMEENKPYKVWFINHFEFIWFDAKPVLGTVVTSPYGEMLIGLSRKWVVVQVDYTKFEIIAAPSDNQGLIILGIFS